MDHTSRASDASMGAGFAASPVSAATSTAQRLVESLMRRRDEMMGTWPAAQALTGE